MVNSLASPVSTHQLHCQERYVYVTVIQAARSSQHVVVGFKAFRFRQLDKDCVSESTNASRRTRVNFGSRFSQALI